MSRQSLKSLLTEIRACRHCEAFLPCGPRPILSAATSARILIIGQAPGLRVHESGVPWQDPSGDRLRQWMGISAKEFYNDKRVALVPMGFCYPGRGKSGDLPPRPECAELWHSQLSKKLRHVRLTLLLGQYSQQYMLGDRKKRTLTETVKSWKEYSPEYLALPHPSPRNNRWLMQNPWFERDVLPRLKRRVSKSLD